MPFAVMGWVGLMSERCVRWGSRSLTFCGIEMGWRNVTFRRRGVFPNHFRIDFLLILLHKWVDTVFGCTDTEAFHAVDAASIASDCVHCENIRIMHNGPGLHYSVNLRTQTYTTSGSAMAEWPRDALVCRNSATYKTSHLKTIVWHYLQTDGQTHDDGIYRA